MFKGFEVQAWFGWIAPIGVPKVDKLTAEVPLPSVLRPFRPSLCRLHRKERETLAPIVEKANIKLN
jgi:hypothetical protein